MVNVNWFGRTGDWDFRGPNVNNLLAPIVQGMDDRQKRRQEDIENRRADEQLGMQRTRLGIEQDRFNEDKAQKVRERAGNLALLTLSENDPARRAERWGQFITTHPNAKGLDPKYHDPSTGPLAILADAGMAQNYLDWQMKQAAEKRANTALGYQGNADRRADETHASNQAQYESMTPEQRRAAAVSLGLQPGSTEANAFIASGKFSPPEGMKLNIVPEGGTLVATNPRTGTHQTIVQGGPKPIKDHESKDAIWAERLLRSDANIDKIAAIDPNTGQPMPGAYNPARTANRFAPDSPGAFNLWTANLFNSRNWQLYQQAAREGIAAILRKDTGAAVTESEWNLYFPMLYPQPGDDAAAVLQKKQAREAASQGMRAASNGAFERMYPNHGKPAAPQGGLNQDGVRRNIGGKSYVLRGGQWFEE